MARKKHVTVAIMIHGHETKHRGATLKQALLAAEKARVRWPCEVKWYSRAKGGSVIKRNRVGGAYLLDGEMVCRREPVYGIVYRGRPQVQKSRDFVKRMRAAGRTGFGRYRVRARRVR